SLTIGVGAGAAPRYIGADSYVPIPFPYVEYKRGGRTLRSNQFGFEADLTKGSNFDFGPVVRIDQGRDDFQDADNAVIEALDDVSAAVEVGGFIATTRPLITREQAPPILFTARASVVNAIGGHDGVVVESSVGLIRPSRKWTYVGTVNASYASGAFQRAFFSVDEAGAAASGLDQFEAEAGFRDVGVTGVVSYQVSQKWSVNSVANYARLVGDAADSPIVTEEGSANQLFFGLNVAYRFF
ncbi:MAG: MipA/OmpV family protein, partial [Pseudomonadota bacterium]